MKKNAIAIICVLVAFAAGLVLSFALRKDTPMNAGSTDFTVSQNRPGQSIVQNGTGTEDEIPEQQASRPAGQQSGQQSNQSSDQQSDQPSEQQPTQPSGQQQPTIPQPTQPAAPEPTEGDPSCSHTYGSWQVKVESTCAQTGFRVKLCTKCNHSIQETVPVKGHNIVAVKGQNATCAATGLTDGKKCADCGQITVAQTAIAKKSHTYGEWTTTKEATCNTAGSRQRTCSGCSTVEKESIDATGKHNYYYENCKDCGAKAKGSENLKYVLSNDGAYYICTGSTGSVVDVLVIPSSYNGKPVKEVGELNNFANFKAKKIILMEGITTIRQGAFQYNSSIVEVYLPKSLTYIGGGNFKDCSKLTAVYIPTTGWKAAVGGKAVDFSSPSGVVEICAYNGNGYRRS